MRKKEVEIGKSYVAKVSGRLTTVRIIAESQYGGWDARSEWTGRAVRIRTAGRLRWPVRRPAAMAITETSIEQVEALAEVRSAHDMRPGTGLAIITAPAIGGAR